MTPQPITTLVFQNAGSSDQTGLLEAILEASEDATYGAAAYAWASANGLRLVLEDDAFVRFLDQGAFDLVIGVDAITDTRCLDAAEQLLRTHSNLSLTVFLHEKSALFHPKLCWFRTRSGGIIIAGSGNLTLGGLRSNWEAFTVTPLSRSQTDALEHQWNQWRRDHATYLLTPSDARVRERAASNVAWEGNARRRPVVSVPPLDEEQALAAETTGDVDAEARLAAPALIAEIPRAERRWRQANFDVQTYEGFFRASVGAKRRILLQYVNTDGTLEPVETRQSVEVKSRNFRIELGHAPHEEYPDAGRPIGLFIRQATDVFHYHVVMPRDAEYATVSEILALRWKGSERRVRRVELTAAELREVWPEGPFWKVAAPE